MHANHTPGYLATPAGDNGKAVLVLHAWWGLNEMIRKFCDRIADSGFVAFAPDLYHGKIARTIAEAGVLGAAVDANPDQAKAEIADAARHLQGQAGQTAGGLAVIGFSLGAYFAVDLACSQPELVRSVVLFYGTGPADLSKCRADFLGHFAENDNYEPRSQADALEAALRKVGLQVAFHHYPGTGHWFFEPDRTNEYNQAAAELAWERTIKFLER